jgi:hypothetical protein
MGDALPPTGPTPPQDAGEGLKTCPNCSAQVPSAARVCRSCGLEFETGKRPEHWVPLPEYGAPPAGAGMLDPGAAPGAVPPIPSTPEAWAGGPNPPGQGPGAWQGQPQQGAWGQPPGAWQTPPGYGPAPYPVAKTNGMAVASLVLGLLWFGGLGSLLALVFGYTAKSQIDRSGGRESGRGLALAGIVLGWIGVVGFVFVLLTIVAATRSIDTLGPGV